MEEKRIVNANALSLKNGSAFAPTQRRDLTNVTNLQTNANAFAYRNIAVAADAENHSVSVILGGRGAALTYPRGYVLPRWLVPVLRSMEERWGREPGWDSYSAEPTSLKHAQRLLEFLVTVMGDDSTPPTITPLPDSGLQAEWHQGDEDLEIVVPSDEPERYYYYNAQTRWEEGEGREARKQVSRLRDLIRQF